MQGNRNESAATGAAPAAEEGAALAVGSPGKILVVDDQRNMRTTLAMMLRGGGFEVDEAADGAEGREQGATGAYDVVITDLRMGEYDGIEVLRAIKEAQPMTEVIVMTAYGTIESAVEAMRLGAFDYIQKPFTEQELIVKVNKALESRRLHGQVRLFAQEFKERYHFENIVGRSQAVRDVLTRVSKIAPTDAIVLITGESGTGKELIARAVHANSKRADRPFVTVNCAAITETLLESELFGHSRGAFTGAVSARKGLFEEADGGTFFFDEIAETTPSFQAKLLRAIQEGEIRRVGENKGVKVDIRVIAATNVDLAQAVEERRFRQDLYYRLNVARFHLPPLRERREDIPLLVEFFLEKYNRKMKARSKLGEGVMDQLVTYDYPGNIRELENMVEQAVALSGGGVITVDDILPQAPKRPSRTTGRTLADIVDDAERRAVEEALRAFDGSRERAAEALDISPTTLWRKMTRLGITYEDR
ncbi:MAG: sigma-54-dependent Fis family transcriptional regulator [Myxococcales bacterium]|nr:sigma-54-dependent Fis family transcriptional regulator [Myxococcales bacterium]MCB9577655.1 sigma-54-dependent Fis family transcriptional regulator [Polyangiaceae bacterium]